MSKRGNRTRRAGWGLLGAVVLLLLAAPAAAQDTLVVPVPAPPADTLPADTLPPGRLSPTGALWRSLLIPGWGQARLGRKLTAGIFLAWEGVTLGMSIKTYRELKYLRRTGSARGDDKAQQHEDWLILLAFNHLLAGLEAYVSGHLTDFPGDIRLRALPAGGAGAAVSLPFRIR